MIRSFADRETERLFARTPGRRFPPELHRVMLRKLLQLDAADRLDDLRIPPGNRLEALKGDRKGQHSIRVNDQWRVCFRWTMETRTRWRLSIITESWGEPAMPTNAKLAPIHPGEVLMEDFLVPLGLSQYRLAQDLSVPPRRINEIVHGKRAITADTALRLARYFGTSEQFWLNLQSRYDLEVERDRLGARLEEEVAVFASQAA